MSEERKGLFIVLEGIDNCGKTTQSTMLKGYLENKGLSVIQTREPGGTDVGEDIREVLKKDRPDNQLMHPVTQTLLFYAARNEFLRNVVRPALDEGTNVITDRFEPSSFVYQGLTQGVDIGFLETLSRQVVRNSECLPDLLVILDISAEESFRRQVQVDSQGEGLIFEKQGLDFVAKLREGYLSLGQESYPIKSPEARRLVNVIRNLKQGHSIMTINGEQSIDAIHQRIVYIVDLQLQQRKILYG